MQIYEEKEESETELTALIQNECNEHDDDLF
jgi:hypothetical protein